MNTEPRHAAPAPHTSTSQQQSWGALIAIFVILAMVIAGAFYAWGQRVATEQALLQQSAGTATSTAP